MQIGYPTDVKHVAHIGWDSQATNNNPSWVITFIIYNEKRKKKKKELSFVERSKNYYLLNIYIVLPFLL